MRVAGLAFVAGLFCAALGQHSAFAEEEPVAIALRYHGGRGCPDEATFFEELQARAPQLRPVGPSGPSYRVDVTVATSGPTSTGDIELHDVDGRVARRHLRGGSCAEVVRALALVIALDAVGTATVQHEPPEPSPPPPAPAPETWPAEPRVVAPVPPALPYRAPAEARWTPLALAQAGMRTGVAPGVAPTGSLVLGVDRAASLGPDPVDSAFLLGVAYAVADASGAGDTVAFRLVSASFDACVWRPSLGPRITLMPCARVTGGYHFADVVPGGRGIAGTGLLAVGLDAWLRVRLAGTVFASATAAAEVPLTPAHFTEEGATSRLFESAIVDGSLNVGVGVSFP